ncbi:MAG: GH25 family lysozyme [Crocinitomicaceae bacterium]|nr:GH25 family lysozyme [Crocinitomicaceae bacterium]MDG1777448.1 GH25 family lysozyme [Crocinitomicaceae bacterium]
MRKRKKKTSVVPLLIFTWVLAVGLLLLYKKPEKEIHAKTLSLKTLPPTFKSYGIDVSHHQDIIDWELFNQDTDSLIKFVYCKATEGTHFLDPQWKSNRKQLTALNITHGAYHFFNPKANPTTQAKYFLRNYTCKQSDLPPVLDAETEGNSTIELIKHMKTWLKYIEHATGKRPIIYTSYHFYNTKFKNAFEGYKFWIANYSNTPNRVKHKNIIHWQYSDCGQIPGIKNKVDLNFSKVDFD